MTITFRIVFTIVLTIFGSDGIGRLKVLSGFVWECHSIKSQNIMLTMELLMKTLSSSSVASRPNVAVKTRAFGRFEGSCRRCQWNAMKSQSPP